MCCTYLIPHSPKSSVTCLFSPKTCTDKEIGEIFWGFALQLKPKDVEEVILYAAKQNMNLSQKGVSMRESKPELVHFLLMGDCYWNLAQ